MYRKNCLVVLLVSEGHVLVFIRLCGVCPGRGGARGGCVSGGRPRFRFAFRRFFEAGGACTDLRLAPRLSATLRTLSRGG